MRVLARAVALSCCAGLVSSAQISKFQHVVVIVQENRTPDNLFQGLCSPPYGSASSCSSTPSASQYDIQTANWLDNSSPTGVTQPGTIALANQYDLNHAHNAFTGMCDLDAAKGACKMDGASTVACGGTCLPTPQFRYVMNAFGILNPYLDLATQYGWANFMSQTNQGPSFPAHQFLFGGTSAPSAADDAAGIFAAENGAGSAEVGCAAPAGTTVDLISPSGSENSKAYPCYEHRTVADIL